jgi:hypothetical protein
MQGRKIDSEPLVSFVTFSRNDNYAGGLRKLYWSTRYLGEQCDDVGLIAEAVIVEWNPPPDREPLALALRDLPASKNLTVRIITVPAHVHARYAHSHLSAMHGAVAANVGLRRARGRFMTIKVADAFYPDSLIRFLAANRLEPNCLYRAIRIDVTAQAAEQLGSPRGEFLAFCATNVAVRHEHLVQPHVPFRLPNLFTNACGDFQLLARDRWQDLRGYWESSDVFPFEADSRLAYSAYAVGLREEVVPGGDCVYKISHSGSFSHRVAYPDSRLTKLMLIVEAGLRRIGFGNAHVFWLRALFNYPPKSYGGVRKPVYERSLLRYKLLSLCPALTRLKSRNWGLAFEPLAEARFGPQGWDIVRDQ